jgi:hypothetical protein
MRPRNLIDTDYPSLDHEAWARIIVDALAKKLPARQSDWSAIPVKVGRISHLSDNYLFINSPRQKAISPTIPSAAKPPEKQ